MYSFIIKIIFLFNFILKADELCFFLNELTGNVNFSINGTLVAECLFNVDITQQLYFFFDLCGKINAIRLIPQCRSSLQSSSSSSSSTTNNIERVVSTATNGNNNKRQSALIDYFKSQLIADGVGGQDNVTSHGNYSGESKASLMGNPGSTPREECRICWDAPIECVFYVCGHMCLCWKW